MSELTSINSYTITNKKLVHHRVTMLTLCIAVAALPISVKFCHTAIILYLINWSLEGNWSRKFAIIKSNVLIILIIVLFFMEVCSTLYSESSGAAGIEKQLFFVLIPIAIATSAVNLTVKNIYQIFYCFIASCLVCTIICLLNSYYQITFLTEGSPLAILSYLDASDFRSANYNNSNAWLSFSYLSLSGGIGIHPTYFSLYLAFAITFLLFRLDEGSVRLRTMYWVLIGYFSLFIILLSSRIIIFGLLVIFIITIVHELIGNRNFVKVAGALIVILLSGSLLYLNPVSRYRNLREIPFTSLHIQANRNYINSTEIRASLWWLGLKASERVNPIWGTGTDDVPKVMKQVSTDYNITNSLDSYDPHNQFLFTLIASGIVGFTLLVALMALSLFFAFVRHDYLYATFIFLFMMLCITESALQLQKGIVFFAIFFSLLAFQKRTVDPIPQTSNAV